MAEAAGLRGKSARKPAKKLRIRGKTMDRTTTPPSIEATARTTDSTIAIAAIAVLIASYAVNAMDRTLFPLMLSDVRREYGFSLPQGGLLSTIFTLGMTIAGIPTGYLMSRFSRKTVIQVGILIYSAATVITVIATGYADMLFYRAITGIGEAMQLTALLAVFSSYFSRNRAAGVGLLNYAYAGGAAIGPWLGAKLLVDYGTWRAPMIIYGIIGLAMMVLIAAVVRPHLSEAKGEESASTSTGGAASLNNLNTIVLAVLSVLFGLALYGYLGMYPTFLREQLHYAPADAGRVMSIYTMCFMGLAPFGSMAAGAISTRIGLGPTVIASGVIGVLLAIGFASRLEKIRRDALPVYIERGILTAEAELKVLNS